jgi:FMN reductase
VPADVEPELKLGEFLGLVVHIERPLAVPLAHQHEPAGIGQGGGERVAPATRFPGGPVLEALKERGEFVPAAADPEHLGDGDHDHHASLVIAGPEDWRRPTTGPGALPTSTSGGAPLVSRTPGSEPAAVGGLRVVGLGGSLRAASRSRAALAVALDGAAAAGARVELLDLRKLGLPMYSPELEDDPPAVVGKLIDTCYEADGMLWSSPMYNGSVSGSFKNAIDWLHMLGSREPPYLHDEVIGLISAAGGTQGLNTMEFSVRSLRGWAVPYVVPVPQATRVFADSGAVQDELVE